MRICVRFTRGISTSQGIASLVVWLTACALFTATAIARESKPLAVQRYTDATTLYQQGSFDRAVKLWREVTQEAHGKDAALSARASLGIAAACQRMGLYQEAQQALVEAQLVLAKLGDAGLMAQQLQLTGNLYVAMHRHAEALELFVAAASKADQAKRPELRAAVLNDYGSALTLSGYATDALTAYRQSLDAARELSLTSLAVAASLNIARLLVERDEAEAAQATLRNTELLLKELPPSYEWAMSILTFESLEQRLVLTPDSEEIRGRIDRLQRVESYALNVNNSRLLSLTYAYQGQAQRAVGERASAEALLRKAVFYATQEQSADVLYLAYWRLAQVLREQGKLDLALDAFDRALVTLAPIRDELLNGHHESHLFFQQQIRPVYADYIDALFASADQLTSDSAQSPVVERARNVIETMTGAELQDYFRDECVVAQERKSMSLEHVTQGVAVLYPIVLADRVELLLVINGEVKRSSVAVNQSQVMDSASHLREFVQDASHRRFMPYANRLYRWLIEPVKSQLIAAGVETLVVVPDGVLRSIPFAALHSGDRYLVEEFALAVTPALKFTAVPRLQPAETKILLAGVAQSVQGFAPLPQVTTELSSIHDYFGGRVIANHDYTKANLRAALAAENYTIVHMATHSTVGATPAESFLLTYDDKLTMSDLENLLRIGEFRDRRVELLTLSACETAIGDERAALGLAGIAVKSGAASVIASLWLVDDKATAALMNRFYKHLQTRVDRRLPTAKALRAAQINLLSDPATEHPANWAAFMLIGSWQ